MLILWRKYNRGRKGAIKFQAAYRGRATRKIIAAIKVQQYYREFIARKKYRKFKSAIVSLQCAARKRSATKLLNELKREQKDVGKLKQNNEKLKMEMASLRAMLAAQAKEGESTARNKEELEAKQNEIERLEKRVAELEHQLNEAKYLAEKLENDLKTQSAMHVAEREQMEQRIQYHTAKRASTVMPGSPKSPMHRNRKQPEAPVGLDIPILPEGENGVTVNPELLAKQRAHVQKLEDQLEAEKKLRREADGEIIKLRAAINGVKLNDTEVSALLGNQKGGQTAPAPNHPKVIDLVTEVRCVHFLYSDEQQLG
jgi:myosin heavy subunit